MKKTLLLLALLANPALADIVGLYAGAQHWQQSWDGSVRDGNDDADVDSALDYGSDNGNVLYVHLEHPLPLLPNLRLRQSELEISGRTQSTIIFDGKTFGAGSKSETDLSHTDVTAYYEVLDNVVSLDLGLTARKFDGGIRFSDGSQSGGFDFDSWIPMLFAGVRADLPFTGLYTGATLDALSIGDSSVTDAQAVIGWESALGLGVEAGFRRFNLNHDDGDEEADLTIDGGFIGVIYHF